MGTEEIIACRREGAILRVSLGHAGDAAAVDQLAAGLEDIRASLLLDASIRLVVLEDADGGGFAIDPDDVSPEVEPPPLLAEPVAGIDSPVVAVIRGDAVGRGLELALACDLRLAAETSRLALPQLVYGLMPADGGTQRLARLVGKATALDMLLTARQLDAPEALRIGLIQRVYPAGELAAKAAEMTRQMVAQAPVALRYAKEAIRAGLDMTLAQGLRLEADLYGLLHTTRDRTEGIRAFQERRQAGFQGE